MDGWFRREEGGGKGCRLRIWIGGFERGGWFIGEEGRKGGEYSGGIGDSF